MGRTVPSSTTRIELCMFYVGKLLVNGVHSTLARLNTKKFATEQIETKYKGSTLEDQFYPELESHICTWLGNQSRDAIKRKASNRCPTPSAGVMLTEYYFSFVPAPAAQAGQLSNYIRRPYNQPHYGLWRDPKLGTVEGIYSNTSRGGRLNTVSF